MDIPLIELPPKIDIELSELYSTPEYRVKTGEYDLVEWSQRTSHKVCDECVALGLEKLKPTIYMRRIPLRGIKFYVCTVHRGMWRERDRLDGTEDKYCDPIMVERVINNYRFNRTDPIGELTECERLTIVIWMRARQYSAADIIRALGGKEPNYNTFKNFLDLADRIGREVKA